MFFEQKEVRRLGRITTRKVSKAKNLLSEVKVALFIPRALHLAVRQQARKRGYSMHQGIRLALMQWVGDGWEDASPPPVIVDDVKDGAPVPKRVGLKKARDNGAVRRKEREALEERLKGELPGTQLLFPDYAKGE